MDGRFTPTGPQNFHLNKVSDMSIIFKDVSLFLSFIFINIHEVARILEVPENAELSCTEMA